MFITKVIGKDYNAIWLSNVVLDEDKLAAYAGCEVKVTSTFVMSGRLTEGFYFLPDGRITKEPTYGYSSCISFNDVQNWKLNDENGRLYGLESGKDKDGDEFYSGRTPKIERLAK